MTCHDLRPYQADAVAALRESMRMGSRAPVLVAPTGSGKTHMARAVVSGAVSKGKRVLFLAPRRELIYQTSEKLADAGIMHGIMMAGENPKPWEPVQVACIPTLHARCIKNNTALPIADLLIIDEAHLSISAGTREVLDMYPSAFKVGLTATPARGDGKALGMVYDSLVMGPSVSSLMTGGFLVPVRYFAPSTPDLSAVKITAGDYNAKQLGHVMDQPILIGDVVANWARIAPDRKTVVFAVNIAHSVHLREQFKAIGVSAEHLDGTMPNDERKAVLSRLRSGETQVITNCQVLTYGWDEPSISCVVLAKPTKSLVMYLQMAGRVLRPFAGKTDAVLIDHSGVVDDLGMVDDDQPWSLDGSTSITQRKAKEPKPASERMITCKGCKATFKAARYCPNCGHDNHSEHAEAIAAYDAELTEIKRRKEHRANKEWTNDEKCRFYAELKGYADDHGYKNGWSDHKYKTKFGVWPNAHKGTPPASPGIETKAWLTSQMIAYSKRKEKLNALAGEVLSENHP